MNNAQQLKKIGENLCILYVEDNHFLREAFQVYLEKFFKRVDVSENGVDALGLYKNNYYDIVITDIRMPEMDGLSLAQEIKAINMLQHIIIVSADKDSISYSKAIRLGIDGYILKPIDYEQTQLLLLKTANNIQNTKENEEYKKHLEELVIKKTEEMKENYIRDHLTNLHNKVYLEEQLQKHDEQTLILLNIDNFSIINYNFGFAVGDKILKEVVRVLRLFENNLFRLYRFQGDEFIFFANSLSLEKAKELANIIKEYFLKNQIVFEQISLNISFTIAIDSGENQDVLRTSSLTIQETREIGKNNIGVYSHDSKFEALQKNNLLWIEKIKDCMNDGRVTIYFQAIKNIKTQKIQKYEVLGRMITTDNELVMPNVFLKLLTLSGMLTRFTKIIIDKAFAFAKTRDIMITINITSEDFKENYLIDFLEIKSKEYNVSQSRVVLEIVESVSMISEDNVLLQLKELKRLGYKLAIDDFGTENSNFSRLLTLKVDFIKIDGSFIKNLNEDKNAQEIVKAIVLFSHKIGSQVVAEFVHSKDIYDIVNEYNIDFAQGYHVGLPQADIIL